jgi:hypothetical protein
MEQQGGAYGKPQVLVVREQRDVVVDVAHGSSIGVAIEPAPGFGPAGGLNPEFLRHFPLHY